MQELKVIDTQALLMQGMESKADAAVMRDLYSLAKEMKADQAKEMFFAALAKFQSECPIINKTREVKSKNGGIMYRYASLDDIILQVKEKLEENGLSFMFKSETVDGGIVQHCEAHHIAGHTEVSSFGVPIDSSSFMGNAQKAGSASSYAKRYSFCNAFGILTGDQDDDGQSLGGGATEQDLYKRFKRHMEAVMENIDTVTAIKTAFIDGDIESAAEAWAEIDHVQVLKNLSMAPTKGGCFSVDERKLMNTDEFKGFMKKFREGRELIGL